MATPRTVRLGNLAIGPEGDLTVLAGLCIVGDLDADV